MKIIYYVLLVLGAVFFVVGGMNLLTKKDLPSKFKNQLITMTVIGVVFLGGSILLQSRVK